MLLTVGLGWVDPWSESGEESMSIEMTVQVKVIRVCDNTIASERILLG